MSSLHAQELQHLYTQAMADYRKKDYPSFYTHIKEANKLNPFHQGIMYQAGIASALTDKKEEAIKFLQQAILIDANFKLEGIADFKSIKDTDEFKELIALQKEWQRSIVHSTVAFTLKDRSIHPEPIAFDASSGSFYLGSIHQRKIIKRTADGVVSDFCKAGTEGMGSVMALKIDAQKNILWAGTSPLQEMENYDSLAQSIIFKFDLHSGKLLQKFIAPKKGVYGDLILDPKGRVYLSDSETNELTLINEKTGHIEPFYSSTEFLSLQGITFSDDARQLFIADYVKGIFRLDVSTKKLTEVTTTQSVSLHGIDGLYFYHHSLIAIQNGVVPARATRYFLDKEKNTITGFEIIDRHHPDFGEPTLGVMAGNTFYYIANSQWGGYDTRHHLKPTDQLKDVIILKAELKP